MIIDWKIILLFITAGLNFAMTIFLLLKNFRDRSHVTFALLSLFAGLWSLGIGIFLLSSQQLVNYFWLQWYYIAAAFLTSLFYYFAVSYCYSVRSFHWGGVIFHILALVLLGFIVTRESFLVVRPPWELIALNPYLYLLYSLYFLSVLIWGFSVLISKYRDSVGFARKQIGIAIAAILTAAIFGVFFDLLLPFVSYKYIYRGFISQR